MDSSSSLPTAQHLNSGTTTYANVERSKVPSISRKSGNGQWRAPTQGQRNEIETVCVRQKKQKQPTQSASATAPLVKTFETGTLKPSEFTVEADTVWKDVVRHEKRLIKLWAWKWDFLVSNKNHPVVTKASQAALNIQNRSKFPDIFMDKCLATRQCNRDLRDAVLQQSSVSHDHVARQPAISIELPEPRTEKAKKVAEINETLFQIKERDRDQPPPHSSKTSQFVVPMTSAGEIGWRLPKPKGARTAPEKNAFDLYPTVALPSRVPKLCFVKEQYGVYRNLKYLQQAHEKEKDIGQTNNNSSVSESETSRLLRLRLPSKAIRVVVNPLLC